MSAWVGRYFKASDVGCPCGCDFQEVHQGVVELADAARESLGVPLDINSSVRCPEYNKEVGGRPASLHLPQSDGLGYALDLTYYRDSDKGLLNMARLYIALESRARRFGVVGLGLYSWGCHVDLRGHTPNPRPAARWEEFPWPRIKRR